MAMVSCGHDIIRQANAWTKKAKGSRDRDHASDRACSICICPMSIGRLDREDGDGVSARNWCRLIVAAHRQQRRRGSNHATTKSDRPMQAADRF
jgi:hypothetical protein